MSFPARIDQDTTDIDGAAVVRERSARLWTELGLLVMVVIWGVNFAVAKWALASIDPLGFNALRHILASAFMIAVLLASGGIGRPRREDVPRIIFLGVVGNVIYQMAFIIGLDRTRAGNASLMLALVPVFLLVLDRQSRGRSGIAWVGALLSVIGVGLVSAASIALEGTDTLLGDLLMIGAGVVWAIYTIGARPLIDRYGPIRTTAWTLLVGSVALLIVGIPSLLRQEWQGVGAAAWGGVLFSSIFSIGVAYLLWYRGVQKLGGARTAVYSNLTPVVALLAGTVWLGERLTPYSVAGAAMVLGGIVLVRRARTL